jgi:uncharacterized membrane protein required for colicin V production
MSWFLDGLALFYILFNGVLGFNRGLVDEFGRLLGLVLSILVATSKTAYLSSFLLSYITIAPWKVTILSFSVIFCSVLICGRIVTRLFKIALLSRSNIWMDNILGFIFGSLKGYCIIAVFIWVIIILPLDKWTMIIEQHASIVKTANAFRENIVSFFGWEDPINFSENFIRKLVQP